MKKTLRIFFVLLAAFLLTLALVVVFTSKTTTELLINGETYTVRLADSPVSRYRGLSGVSLADLKNDASGMAFVFGSDDVRTFVMRGMKFLLDIVWVRNGLVVNVDENIPAPREGEEPRKVSSDPLTADMVLEFPAGFAHAHDLFIGASVKLKE
jgi:uncharacterized membrane protein (UPF0127 family)